MSELKVIDLGNIRESIEKDEPVYYEYYAKSEADKVIAEKDAEIERLRGESCKLTDGCLRLKQCRKEKANIADELRHSNRERCLIIAKWCFEKSYSTTLVKYDKESGLRLNFYDWWGKRWLELAEEPTWAKFLQLIHKEAK